MYQLWYNIYREDKSSYLLVRGHFLVIAHLPCVERESENVLP